MRWCTREEIREVSDQAQQIHDAIRHGRLRIHAHDGHTTVAVGTYTTGESIHLHGEDHLRVENYTYGSGQDAQNAALTDFGQFHGDAVHPGPAPLPRTEREADQARRPLPAQPTTTTSRQVNVPVYAADPANAPAVLDRFVTDHPEWHKHHQWPAEATYALHESLTLRVELYHGHAPGPQDEMWTIAAYESPVSDHLWHATATATAGTPAAVITTLLASLTDEHDWSSTTWATSTAHPDRKPALPLADYSWQETTTETGAVWTSPDEGCHLQRNQSEWEAGNQSWTVQFSQHTPPEIIQQVVFELAEGRGPRLDASRAPHPPTPLPAPAAGPPIRSLYSTAPRSR
ncbi:DUF317 domain-containing protein [Streptomyces sp. SID4944]|nr:DUF317 domain-containing protein [Streptomyces sp. SID4944]